MAAEIRGLSFDRPGGLSLQGATATWEPAAEEVHPLFKRQREPTADQFLELPLALGLERSQSLFSLATDGGRVIAFPGHA
jgi:hypothetical protein